MNRTALNLIVLNDLNLIVLNDLNLIVLNDLNLIVLNDLKKKKCEFCMPVPDHASSNPECIHKM
jgi:hypothetical protein